MAAGPLDGVRVLEFAGLGPSPFAGMLLSDLGAEVLRIDRPGAGALPNDPVTARGRTTVRLDLKAPASVETCLALSAAADILIEGFRPGVMERLGLGPEPALARNPRLVYGRMTGWGQSGPLAARAGHDINYIALSGALHAIGPAEKPTPPLNLLGDFGGGALYLALGVLAALTHARASGQGQVVDCAMVDGAASLMALIYGLKSEGLWEDRRAANLLDGAAPFYDTYACADGAWVAVGALEPPFFAILLERLDLDPAAWPNPFDRSRWPALRTAMAQAFAGAPREHWRARLEGLDACFAPVLSMAEAPLHPHNQARSVFVEHEGRVQPAPAPRFSATPGAIQPTSEDADILARWTGMTKPA